jgi:hypothetical protein
MDNPETLTTYGTRNRTLSILVYITLLYRNVIENRSSNPYSKFYDIEWLNELISVNIVSSKSITVSFLIWATMITNWNLKLSTGSYLLSKVGDLRIANLNYCTWNDQGWIYILKKVDDVRIPNLIMA